MKIYFGWRVELLPWAAILALVGTTRFACGQEPVAARGGDYESQANAQDKAIADGVRWVAAQQNDDGGWRFQNEMLAGDRSSCQATGLVLLAFLGAGQTTDTGKYAQRIGQAVDFLESWAAVSQARADLRGDGGTLVSHGIAATALCELRGMIKSPNDRLRRLTEAAVQQSLAWQDEQSGGWGLQPDQPLHLRPTVWQIMLLDSATLAGMDVPESALRHARECLKAFQTADERQTKQGPFFGLTGPGTDPTATALGAYGRLRHDWSPVQPWSRQIARRMLDDDFTPASAEGEYFANEIYHWSGDENKPEYRAWSARHRETVQRLVRSQSQDAELAGSWNSEDARSSRLETTAYRLLTLEIRYCFRPLSLGGAFRESPMPNVGLLRDVGLPVRAEKLTPARPSP